MISCTEFIPMYSELFWYIDGKAGHDAVVRYWRHLEAGTRDNSVEDTLGRAIERDGIRGIYHHFKKNLLEEAADFYMTYDDEEQVYECWMRHCPSRGLLNSLEHMEPYYDYCGHCGALYPPVFERHGVAYNCDYESEAAQAKCYESARWAKPEDKK